MTSGLYPSLIFVHVCSVIGRFVAISFEAATVYRLGTTKVRTVVRENLSTLAFLEKALPASAGLVLISGVSMTLLRWGWTQTWIDNALAVLVLLGVLGPIVTGPGVTRIRNALVGAQQPGDDLPEALVRHLTDPVLLGYAPILQWWGWRLSR